MTKPFCLTTYLIGFFGAPDPRVVKPKAPVHRVACRVCGWYVASVVAGRSTDDSKSAVGGVYWQVARCCWLCAVRVRACGCLWVVGHSARFMSENNLNFSLPGYVIARVSTSTSRAVAKSAKHKAPPTTNIITPTLVRFPRSAKPQLTQK